MLLDPQVFLTPGSIGAAIEVTVANIDSPTELNSRSAAQGDLIIARTTQAGDSTETLYYADTTSSAQDLPYIVSSATAGVKFLAMAGYAHNQLLKLKSVSNSTPVAVFGNINAYSEINIQNLNSSSSASTDLVATADNGTASTHYVNLGINGSTGGVAPFTTANAAYLLSTDNELDIAALGATGAVNIAAGATPTILATFDITNGITFNDKTTNTKQFRHQIANQNAATIFTLDTGAQTVSRTLSVPVLGANDTIATLAVANVFTAAQSCTSTIASKQTSAAGISLDHNSATGNFTVRLSPANLATSNRRWVFPDADSTVAGLSVANTFTADQTLFYSTAGFVTQVVRNSNTGAGTYAALQLINDGPNSFYFRLRGSGNTSTIIGNSVAQSVEIVGANPAPLVIGNISGSLYPIIFGNGNVERWRIDDVDGSLLGSVSTDSSSLSTGSFRTPGGAAVTKRSFLGTIGSTFKGNVLAGVQDGTAAVAGQVGEEIKSTVSGVAAGSTGAAANATSISLTAGDWLLSGYVVISAGATGLTSGSTAKMSIVTTSATNGTSGDTMVQESVLALLANGLFTMSLPAKRVSISSTTTHYLTTEMTYAAGSPTVAGTLTATRVR